MSRAPWYAKTYKNNNFIDMLNRNKRLTCVLCKHGITKSDGII